MKKTLKFIGLFIITFSILLATAKIIEYKQPQTDPYEAKIQSIMQEQDFIKSVRLQAETIQAKRDKEDAEKRLEQFRKKELELASSTRSL